MEDDSVSNRLSSQASQTEDTEKVTGILRPCGHLLQSPETLHTMETMFEPSVSWQQRITVHAL